MPVISCNHDDACIALIYGDHDMRRYIMNYPDGLWDEIEAYRVIQGLKTTADAIRVLVEGGLTRGIVKSISQPGAVVSPAFSEPVMPDIVFQYQTTDPAPLNTNVSIGPQPVTPGARLKTKGKK